MSTTYTQLNVTINTPTGTPVHVYVNVSHDMLSDIVRQWDGMDVVLDTVTTVSDSTVTTDYLTPCPYDHSHTSAWCGHPQCRQS